MSQPKRLKDYSDTELIALYKEHGEYTKVAKIIGCSYQAVSKRLKTIKGQVCVVTRAVSSNQNKIEIDQQSDSAKQLREINQEAKELLNIAKKALTISAGDKDENGNDIYIIDQNSANIMLRAMAEIRGQLDLNLKITTQMYGAEAVQIFQDSVLEAIGEVSEDVRVRVMQRVRERTSSRAVIK